ncbi:helix-turn-helix domain-containing protein [Streptomyces sp. NBC_00201]|uniref:helix-turn-helix domain-containing protein n=1 Tax=unclassified Streptomyces TaxID=2593676 RepID=UPI00225703D7|nr:MULTISPECIES: helix-turn-helix domain-containing protein [unclassified Streptomyces]MCX5057857.1 helix-turn-helix domain-containing protein [Streptomyces sp. NBC_00452]MCX5245265.1 helix-turn-helix domain-containing protein [Streptomyces sp. NBC_00201]MCX5289005.1 helix-turn-helix domain-containing protein [Streptomyces sp. NBC_00183]
MNFHGTEVRQRALTLLRDGNKNADVARTLNIPLGTIGYWKHADRAKRGECPGAHNPACPRCDGRPLDLAAYSYLLGQYLGDGHISHYVHHRVPSLMISCADAWPGVANETEAAMRAVFPTNNVHRVQRIGCQTIKAYNKHLTCLFPQHGPGRKHERLIALEPWQQDIVDAHPWEFIRGLIHSDGCRITNWTTRLVGGERKRYEYPRYFFTNKSDDIRKLFTDTLDKVGVKWTTLARGSDPFNISIARKASVALMDTHVGPKY